MQKTVSLAYGLETSGSVKYKNINSLLYERLCAIAFLFQRKNET